MAGLALLPSPVAVSLAALVTTPVNFMADMLVHPTAASSISGYTIFGGLLILLSFGVIIWRDSRLLDEVPEDVNCDIGAKG